MRQLLHSAGPSSRSAGPSLRQAGFTLIELILAMAVFSMMLLIIVNGFITVVHLHNSAMALNDAQDNARSAMDQVTQAVRNASPTADPVVQGSAPVGATLCLQSDTGPEVIFYVTGTTLYRADGCTARLNQQALTNANVMVTNFDPTVIHATGSAGSKADVEVSLTVATNNGTTNGAPGEAVQCGVGTSTQTFCSVVTLKSGVTPR
ncbi:MAG TPA: prepilin-type N-terminal cleavage/methylation domain-containing protein [Candidatus Saccharimonadia bacterium]